MNKTKKLTLLALVVAMFMAFSCAIVSIMPSSKSYADGTEVTLTGTGTEADPYLIEGIDDLIIFRNAVNGGNTYSGKHVKLTADIDLNDEKWTPIGTEANKFMGTFDGDSHTISNMAVVGAADQGFFGYITEAKINNLNINNVAVTGTDCVGAIAGQGYASTYIDNCHVSGSIKIEGQTNVGGITGKYYARVTNSSVIGDGTATSYVKGVYVAANFEGDNVGGIMGHAGENNTHSGNTVKNITVSGTRKVGGLIGTTDRATDLLGSAVDNVVIESTATADYASANSATTTIGGLIGNYYGSSTGGTVTNCTVKSVTLDGNGVVTNSGAIVGGVRVSPEATECEGVTASSNEIYASTITGTTNKYLMTVVAAIGETNYYSLQDAINNAAEGATVTLISDVTLEETINITAGKKVTLDLNGKTIDFVEDWVYGATNSGTALITVNFGGDLTIDDTSDDKSGTLNGYDENAKNAPYEYRVYGAVMMTVAGDDSANGTAKLTVDGGTLIGTFAAIGGNRLRDNTEIVINGGTIKCGVSENYSSVGIDHPQNGKLTINGGKIEGMDGISLRSGTLLITGGTIVGNAPESAFEDDGYWDNNFGTCTGHALQIVSRANSEATQETPSVSITGGTFRSENTAAVGSYAGYKGTTPDTQIVGFISGGTFVSGGTIDQGISAYVAEGCGALKDLDGNYVVGEKPTATVNNLGMMTISAGDYNVFGSGSNTVDMPLSFVMQFLADQDAEDMANSPYADWYGDFVLTFTGIENGSFTADGCYLAGYYGDYGWIVIPVDGMTIDDGVRYPVMLGVGMGQKYDYICESVKDFRCALYLTPEILEANPNIGVSLELSVVDNSQGADAAKAALEDTTLKYVNVVGETEYDAEDFVTPVAKIGETYYETLADAIAEAAENDTITVLTNIELSEGVTVPAGKIITLDLNGYTISGTCNANEALITVKNTAELTIKDSSEGSNGKITYAAGNSNIGYTVHVEGSLILESGTIELTGEWNTGFAVDVRANSWGTNEYTAATTFEMNGGKIISSDSAVRVASSSVSNHENVSVSFTMNDGVIDCGWDAIFIQHWVVCDLTAEIKGGEISGTNSALRIYGDTAVNKVNLTVTGGDFNGDIKNLGVTGTGKTAISGGTFSVDVSQYCANGYTCKETDDDRYGVVEADYYVVGHSVSFDGIIGYNFYVVFNKTDVTVSIKVGDDERINVVVSKLETVDVKINGVQYNGIYFFQVPVNAVEMTQTITFNVVDDGTTTIVKETSIELYATKVLESDFDEKTDNLMISLLNYGATAQTLLNKNTEKLANAQLTEEQKKLDSVTYDSAFGEGTGYEKAQVKDVDAEDNIIPYRASLLFESETTLRIYFYIEAESIESIEYKFYLCLEETETELTLNYNSGNYYYVDIVGVASNELANKYKVVAKDAKGNEVASVTYSAINYMESALRPVNAENVALQDLAKAMYLYSKAANAYFAN